MCEIKVVLDQGGTEKLLMENVTRLDVLENGISITSLFEGPKEIARATVRNIDFIAGKVFLEQQG